MTDEELCRRFGTTLEEVDRDVDEFENGSWDGIEFSEPIEGRPVSQMKTASFKLYDFEMEALDRAAAKAGMSRSAFIRKAVTDELVEMS